MEPEEAPCCSSFSDTEPEADALLTSTADGPVAADDPRASGLTAPPSADSHSHGALHCQCAAAYHSSALACAQCMHSHSAPVLSVSSTSDGRCLVASLNVCSVCAAWEGAPPEATAQWRSRRKSAEWRAHWLELRLADLQRQTQRYEAQLAALRAAEPASQAKPQQGQLQQQPQPAPVSTAEQEPVAMQIDAPEQPASASLVAAAAEQPAEAREAETAQQPVQVPALAGNVPLLGLDSEPKANSQQLHGKAPERRLVAVQAVAFPAPSPPEQLWQAPAAAAEQPLASAPASTEAAPLQLPPAQPGQPGPPAGLQPSLPELGSQLDRRQPSPSGFQHPHDTQGMPSVLTQPLVPVTAPALRQPGPASSSAPQPEEPRQPLAEPAAAGEQPQQQQQQQQQQPCMHRRKPRTEVPEFAPGALLRHPFFASQAGVRRSPQVRVVGCICAAPFSVCLFV